MAIERIIGVDFGTSTSVIRVKRYENGKPVGQKLDTKEVIFSGMGNMVPTLIQKKDEDESVAYYGFEAKQKKQNSTTYHSFKVDLESNDPDKRALARQLTEEFLTYLAKQYHTQSDGGHLGDFGDKERTIISYPVKWSEETKQFMIEAAKNAGFPNVSGMDEAQAAIHAVTVQSTDHLKQHGFLTSGVPANILLIDMGAGTTDLVLCCHTPGETPKTEIITTWPKSGEILFGGREVDHLLQNFFRDFMEPEALAKALKSIGVDQFKSWKEKSVSPALAKMDMVEDFFPLQNYCDIADIEMDDFKLDRGAFEKCLADYLKQLPELVNGCLQDAGMDGSEVDLVIVTGGHSQWYFVEEMLIGKMPQFGKIELIRVRDDPARVIPISRPQETVALGLAYNGIKVEIQKPPEPVITNNMVYIFQGKQFQPFFALQALDGLLLSDSQTMGSRGVKEKNIPVTNENDELANKIDQKTAILSRRKLNNVCIVKIAELTPSETPRGLKISGTVLNGRLTKEDRVCLLDASGRMLLESIAVSGLYYNGERDFVDKGSCGIWLRNIDKNQLSGGMFLVSNEKAGVLSEFIKLEIATVVEALFEQSKELKKWKDNIVFRNEYLPTLYNNLIIPNEEKILFAYSSSLYKGKNGFVACRRGLYTKDMFSRRQFISWLEFATSELLIKKSEIYLKNCFGNQGKFFVDIGFPSDIRADLLAFWEMLHKELRKRLLN